MAMLYRIDIVHVAHSMTDQQSTRYIGYWGNDYLMLMLSLTYHGQYRK